LEQSKADQLEQVQAKVRQGQSHVQQLIGELSTARRCMHELETQYDQQNEKMRSEVKQSQQETQTLQKQLRCKDDEMKEVQSEQRRLQQLLQVRLKAIAEAEDKALQSESKAKMAEQELKQLVSLRKERDDLKSQASTLQDELVKANRHASDLGASVQRLLEERDQALQHLQQIQGILVQLPGAKNAVAWNTEVKPEESAPLTSQSLVKASSEMDQWKGSSVQCSTSNANYSTEDHSTFELEQLLLQMLHSNGTSFVRDNEPDMSSEYACCAHRLNDSIESISESVHNLNLSPMTVKKHKKQSKKEVKRGLSKFGLSDKKLKFNFL
jgi:chromosome segregation ATPase